MYPEFRQQIRDMRLTVFQNEIIEYELFCSTTRLEHESRTLAESCLSSESIKALFT